MRIGRLLQQQMRPDGPNAVADRLKHRAAGEQAVRERMDKYPVLTAENANEAIRWQEARMLELMR